jgi:hypothetical protein
MNKFSKTLVRAILALGKIDLAQVETDKGVLTYADELKEGAQVFLINENNESVTAPDGAYTVATENGNTVIEVKDGSIVSITSDADLSDDDAILALTEKVIELQTEIEQIKALLKLPPVDAGNEEGAKEGGDVFSRIKKLNNKKA